MKKSDKKFVIDSLIFILFMVLAATGLFLYLKLPPGSHGAEVLGLNRHTWGEIHFWIAMGFLAFIVYHLILNWNWISCMIKGRYKDTYKQKKNVTVAVVTLLLFLLILILPFLSPVDDSERGRDDNIRGKRQSIERNQ